MKTYFNNWKTLTTDKNYRDLYLIVKRDSPYNGRVTLTVLPLSPVYVICIEKRTAHRNTSEIMSETFNTTW